MPAASSRRGRRSPRACGRARLRATRETPTARRGRARLDALALEQVDEILGRHVAGRRGENGQPPRPPTEASSTRAPASSAARRSRSRCCACCGRGTRGRRGVRSTSAPHARTASRRRSCRRGRPPSAPANRDARSATTPGSTAPFERAAEGARDRHGRRRLARPRARIASVALDRLVERGVAVALVEGSRWPRRSR